MTTNKALRDVEYKHTATTLHYITMPLHRNTLLQYSTWGAKATLAPVHPCDALLDRVHPLAHAADAFHGGHMAPVH